MANIPSGLAARRAFWFEHARRCELFDGKVEAYAAEHGLPVKALYRWRGLARREGLLDQAPVQGSSPESGFVRLEVMAARTSLLRVVLPNGCTVEISAPLEPELIATVLRQSAAL